MSGTDLAVHTPPSIQSIQRGSYDREQVDLIRATVAKECNDAELALFLETCARHQLDPFIKEVWAIRMTSTAPVQTVVSRDGLLRIANRYTGSGWANQPGEFQGCSADAVHGHDFFKKETHMREDGSEKIVIVHDYRDENGEPTHGGDDGEARGPMIGAWGRVRRRGHDDTYFFCYRKEYDKDKNVWKSHPHAMMVKVAEAMALRKAFSISGVVGEGEVDPRDPSNPSAGADAGTGTLNWPADEALTEELKAAFRAAGYRRAKVRALLDACELDPDYRNLLNRTLSELPEAAREDLENAVKIEDATVVGDDGAPEATFEAADGA